MRYWKGVPRALDGLQYNFQEAPMFSGSVRGNSGSVKDISTMDQYNVGAVLLTSGR